MRRNEEDGKGSDIPRLSLSRGLAKVSEPAARLEHSAPTHSASSKSLPASVLRRRHRLRPPFRPLRAPLRHADLLHRRGPPRPSHRDRVRRHKTTKRCSGDTCRRPLCFLHSTQMTRTDRDRPWREPNRLRSRPVQRESRQKPSPRRSGDAGALEAFVSGHIRDRGKAMKAEAGQTAADTWSFMTDCQRPHTHFRSHVGMNGKLTFSSFRALKRASTASLW